jgi:hypothetical protein
MSNFLFRKTCYNETFRSDVFASPYCPLLFAYLAFDTDRLFCSTEAALDTLATWDPQLRQSWDHLLVPGPEQEELLADISLESLFNLPFSSTADSLLSPHPLSAPATLHDGAAAVGRVLASAESGKEPFDVNEEAVGSSLLRGLGHSLTVHNVGEAVRLACQHRLVTQRELGLRTIRNSFYDVETSTPAALCGGGSSGAKRDKGRPNVAAEMLIASVSLLRGPGDHLRRFLCGGTALMEPSLVLSVLRLSDREGDKWEDDWLPAYEALRKSVGSMTTDELELFLLFTVSSRMVDPGKTVISVKPTLDPGAYPTSSTCEHSLTIPVACDDLHDKLIAACESAHASGFLRR